MSNEQTVTIIQPDTSELAMPPALLDERKGLIICDAESHQAALEIVRECKRREKLVDETLAESITAANKTHKALTGLRSKLKKPYEQLRKPLEREAGDYVERERRRAEQEAREKARKQREEEEAAALAQAQEAADAGDQELADTILEQATTEAPVVVNAEPEVAKVEGVSGRTTWSAEVVDLAQLCRYAADHPEWIGLVQPNQKALDALARAQKDGLRIPGVRAKKKHGLAVRT